MLNYLYAIGLSFLITVIISPGIIRILTRLKFGQQIRQSGPQRHLAKKGTPTMGGVMIILAVLLTTFGVIRLTDQVLWSLFLTLSFGLIGLIDDLIKIIAARSLGLKAWQKILGQLVISGLLALYVFREPALMEILIPFTNESLNLGFWMIPFLIFMVIGTVNGVNLTDGLDGLASGVTLVVSLGFALIFILQANTPMAAFAFTVAGACLGFIWFNSHPAQVIMGDTGSFALGGAIASMAIFGRSELFLVLIGGVYVIESITVLLQISYFKLTGGRRIFRMTPIHHHFELIGWQEPQIVARFIILSLIFAIIGLIGYIGFI